MKKLFISILLGLMLVPLGPLAFADDTTEASGEEVTEETTRPLIPKPDFLPGPDSVTTSGDTISGEDTQDYVLNTTIPRVINIVLGLFGIGTFLAILISAVNMLIAWGNEDKVTKAKKNLQFSILGFVLSLFAYAIVSIAVSIALPSDSPETSFIDHIIPSAYAEDTTPTNTSNAANSLDTLLPSQYDLIESQGGTDDEPGRGVALPSGDLVGEIIPAIITNIMFAVGFLIFIGFMYGGVLMVYGRGNEEHVGKAKNIIVYSSIALGLMGFGYAIVYGIATINFDQDENSTLDDVYVDTEDDE